MSRFALALAASFALAAPALAWFAPQPITGRWMTKEKDSIVTISQCGATVCGRLSRYLVMPKGGTEQKDVNNPDPEKRKRKLLGTALMWGLKPDGDVWRGTIYDPRNGKSYRSVVRLKSADVLEVKGCIGPFCQAQEWTRAK